MSRYDQEKDEVAALEDLIGSHRELGGDQTKLFIIHPVEFNLNDEPIICAGKSLQSTQEQNRNSSTN